MPRTPTRLAFTLVLALVCGGCGGGSSAPKHQGVEAFPDVLEIARSELGDDAVLHAITVDKGAISFVHVQFGRTTRITYNPQGVFTGSKRLPNPHSLNSTFGIADVAAEAPRRLLTAVRKKDGTGVKDFSATLAVDSRGALVWRATATVGSSKHQYTASPDGTLRS